MSIPTFILVITTVYYVSNDAAELVADALCVNDRIHIQSLIQRFQVSKLRASEFNDSMIQ